MKASGQCSRLATKTKHVNMSGVCKFFLQEIFINSVSHVYKIGYYWSIVDRSSDDMMEEELIFKLYILQLRHTSNKVTPEKDTHRQQTCNSKYVSKLH